MDAERMWRLNRELKARNEALVELTHETRWERPSVALGTADTPTSGYALCASTLSTVLQDRRAYVSDVNHDHKWRKLFAVYETLDDVADALLDGKGPGTS